MKPSESITHPKFGGAGRIRRWRAAAVFAAALVLAPPLFSQTAAGAASGSSVPPSLSIDEAVASALAKDPGVISANLDWLSAKSKADSASWKRLPSITANAGYTRLSDLPASAISLDAFSISLPASLDNAFSFGVNLQYPVFAGFRVKENIAISALQVQAKDVAQESVRRALAFDVRRAYWEAVRATYNIETLQQNLDLMQLNSDLATKQFGQGVATLADQLAAQMRLQQAGQDLGDARSLQKRAFLALASLTGADVATLGISTADDAAPPPFALSTKPDETTLQTPAAPSPKLDEASLISAALSKRPETRAAGLARSLAERSVALSRAALYPTVAVTGNYTLADPNQRVPFQTDPLQFTGTWALGLQMSYDVGGIPAALDDIKAQTLAASKAKSDEVRQRNAVVMDVENCIVNLQRALRDLESSRAMVAQAEENLRVVQGRVAAGTAKDIDLSTSKFDLLRINFNVTNRRIDALIAQADLARATASEDLK